MMIRTLPLLLCGLLPLLATAGTVHELRPFTASYTFDWRGMDAGSATFTLQKVSEQEWTYRSRTEPHGLFSLVSAANATLQSRMSVGPAGVRPQVFLASEGSAGHRVADLSFDWDHQRVTGTAEGQAIDMPLKPGVQDDLSVQVALMFALATGTTPNGFSVFDKSGIRDYEYTREATETLHTPLGDIATVIYRSHRAGSPRSTRFWCAPAYGYIPMRAQQRREERVEWTMDLRTLQRD
jgi:hypothetical protein